MRGGSQGIPLRAGMDWVWEAREEQGAGVAWSGAWRPFLPMKKLRPKEA